MGRKGAKEQRQLARDEFEFQRGTSERQQKERTEARNLLMPEYQRLYDESFGYTPTGFTTKLFSDKEREGLVSTGVRAGRLPYEAAEDQAGQRLSRTRNTAGYGALAAELARGKSRGVADVTRRVTGDITAREAGTRFERNAYLEDERLKRRYGGLAGLAQLYGIDTQLLASQMGRGTQALGAHAAGIEPGKWETVMNPIIGGAASAAGSYYGARG